jgi:transcriptional antiterminator
MIKHLNNEKWKPIAISSGDVSKNYMISSHGRVAVYAKSFAKDGELLKQTANKSYRSIKLYVKGKAKNFLVHRLMAQTFIKRTGKKYLVIHLNHKLSDNKLPNLAWATMGEVAEHNRNIPSVQEAYRKIAMKFIEQKKGRKLTLNQVIKIKKTLADPKRKLTFEQLSEKYGVSTRAINRIKTGENWGLVEI